MVDRPDKKTQLNTYKTGIYVKVHGEKGIVEIARRHKGTRSMKKLFGPIKIGKMELKNRIVMPPMVTNFANTHGCVTEKLKNYYVERAKGGVGLIIIEATCVDHIGKHRENALGAWDDKHVPGLRELAEAVKQEGPNVSVQIYHAGGQTTSKITGTQPIAPSSVPYIVKGEKVIPREFSIEEIHDLVEKFSIAAERIKEAGFDAVEIHGAHGYAIAQFLSPLKNKRTDEYGKDLEGRTRLALEVVQRVIEKVGDFPIVFRISGDEHVVGGLTLEDAKIIARMLEKVGVDAIHVAAGCYESALTIYPPMTFPQGVNLHLAEEIKRVVNVPVIAVGRLHDPVLADKIIAEGKADLVSMGRALIADPNLPRKALEGRFDDIRPCISCNQCVDKLWQGYEIACLSNPMVGKEKEYGIEPTKKPKKILIAGGGPAGMEAARTAASRGHDVTLYERNDKLGGQLFLATVPPSKEEMKNLLKYLTSQIHKLGVKIELAREVTPAIVEKANPDVVIVATGATPLIPRIVGVDGENVVTAWDVLAGKAEVGGKVIMVGGGLVGCETSIFLAERKRKVTIVEMLEDIALGEGPLSKMLLLQKLSEYNINVLTNTIIDKITREGVIVTCGRETQTLKADTVVLAAGSKSNTRLIEELRGKIRYLYSIGDCVEPRKALEAIHEGADIARKI